MSIPSADASRLQPTFDVPAADWEEVQVYGYRITAEHPLFGPVSAVMSFRNTSNGYYGGWMDRSHKEPNYLPEHQLFADKVG